MGEFLYSCAPTRSNWLRAMRCDRVVKRSQRRRFVHEVWRETGAEAQARRAVEEAFGDAED